MKFCLAIALLLIARQPGLLAETFSTWRTSHFTVAQVADVIISGENADPDGDGVGNLLEYAFASNPWVAESGAGTAALPVVKEEENHLTLVFRRARNAYDLFVGLQTSSDLLTWTFPNGVANSFDYTFDDYYLITLTDPQTVGEASQRFLRLTVAIDTDQDGLPDNWEMRYFGNLFFSSYNDLDGDLLNNLTEFRQQTDPTDYYNGSSPQLVIVGGDNQMPEGNEQVLAQPLTIRVQTISGTNLANAPVDFSVTTGQGYLNQVSNVRTSSNGLASVTYTPVDAAHEATILAKVRNYSSSVTFSVQAKVDAPIALRAERRSTGEVEVGWFHPAVNEVSFTIERASDGAAWLPIATAPTGSTQYTDTTAIPGVVYIYRIKAQGSTTSLPSQIIVTEPEEDADFDGLTNQEEATIGSLLQNAYSDSDLVADGEDAIPTDGDITFARLAVPHFAIMPLPEGFYVTAVNASGVAVGFDAEGMKVWANGQLLPIPIYAEGEHGLSNITFYGNAYIDDQGKIAFTQHGYGTGLDAINGNANDGYGHLTGIYQYNGTAVIKSGSILSSPVVTPTGYEGYAGASGITHDGHIYGGSLGLVAPYITTPGDTHIEDRYYDSGTYWTATNQPVEIKGFPYSNDAILNGVRSRILGVGPSSSTVYNQKGLDDINSIYGANALGRLCGSSIEYYDCSIEFLFHRPGWDASASYLGRAYQLQHIGLLWPSATALPISLGEDAYPYSINDLDIVAGYKNAVNQISTLWLGSKDWAAKDLPLYGEKKKYIFPTAINTQGMMLMSNYTDLWVNGFSYDLGEQCGKTKGTVYAGRLTESSVMSASVLDPQTGIYNNAILLPVELITDLNNDGKITSADNSLFSAAYKMGATDEEKEKGTEYIFANDQISNGAWDKEDNTTPGKPASVKDDDDAKEIKLKIATTAGEVWFEHPAIDAMTFYKTKECNASEKIDIKISSKFQVSSTHPLPERLFVRVDGTLDVTSDNPQKEGDLVMKLKFPGTNSMEIEASKIKFTVVRELRAKKYFEATRGYILENNTLLRVDDKQFPERGANPNCTIRICLMREEGTIMSPFESYWDDAYQGYLDSHPSPTTPFDPQVYTYYGFGIDGALAADSDMTVVINGNQCDFTDPSLSDPRTEPGRILRLSELTALSLSGTPGLTDRCHGRVIINDRKNQSSSDHDDETTLIAGTSYRGSSLAGEDPVTGTANPGGKYIAQFENGHFKMGAGRVPWPNVPGNVPTTPLAKSAIGGLSGNYSSSDRNNYPNSFVGFAPMAKEGYGVVFVATGKGSDGNGKVKEFYEAAKSSGVPEIPGATPSAGLNIINLALLDSGNTSCALSHKTPAGTHQMVYKGSKHGGFPYYTNTFLRFKATKPRE